MTGALVMAAMFMLSLLVPRICGVLVACFFGFAGCSAASHGEPLNAVMSFLLGGIAGGLLCFMAPRRNKPKEAPRP